MCQIHPIFTLVLVLSNVFYISKLPGTKNVSLIKWILSSSNFCMNLCDYLLVWTKVEIQKTVLLSYFLTVLFSGSIFLAVFLECTYIISQKFWSIIFSIIVLDRSNLGNACSFGRVGILLESWFVSILSFKDSWIMTKKIPNCINSLQWLSNVFPFILFFEMFFLVKKSFTYSYSEDENTQNVIFILKQMSYFLNYVLLWRLLPDFLNYSKSVLPLLLPWRRILDLYDTIVTGIIYSTCSVHN